jgi:hypothetical protein
VFTLAAQERGMITVETRGINSETRSFTSPATAKAFVVNAQRSGRCALIKYTANGRSSFFEFADGAWTVR